jgi:biopolymer transport protein ExbD
MSLAAQLDQLLAEVEQEDAREGCESAATAAAAAAAGSSAGALVSRARALRRAALEARLAQFKAADPDLPVVVKGDARVQYDKVIEVLDLVGRLEITQLGLVTQRLTR